MRHGLFWGLVLGTALAFGAVGCSDDSSNGGTGGSGGSAGAGGTAGSGGMAGAGGAAGMAGMGGEGGMGGGMPSVIHGCTFDTAMDMTGNASVNVTDIAAWMVPHDVCVIVSEGTEVVWDGNFSVHPLAGGISPNVDGSSPITEAEANLGVGSAEVTLPSEGTYPYFCEIHTGTMTGVVYVVP